ncbi:MAG: hypothetical protein HYX69_06105 [Planctomycetia bacterium]|nr:hypothetical protein [Planctomycetia bacterium]
MLLLALAGVVRAAQTASETSRAPAPTGARFPAPPPADEPVGTTDNDDESVLTKIVRPPTVGESESLATDDGPESVEPPEGACGGSELWLVSTRGLPLAGDDCCAPQFAPCVFRYQCGRGFVTSTLEELRATDDSSRVTAIFVHGNDTTAEQAATGGRQLYGKLLHTCCPMPPVRLVIWSWPSETDVLCKRRDFRLKACRTNIEGYFLATFVDSLPPATRVSMAGYSYGARVVSGGLHMLAGGMLEGRVLRERMHTDRPAPSAILMGGAMDNDWLLPGMRHQDAMSQVQRMVVTYNRFDPVLRWYPMLWGRGGTLALGVTGVADPGQLGMDRNKLVEINVARAVHCRHGWKYYSGSPQIMALLRRELVYLPSAELVAQ